MITEVQLDDQLAGQMCKYFATAYSRAFNKEQIRKRIVLLVRHGSLRLADDGDRIRVASVIDNDRTGMGRDNSYVKYDLLPDQNARFRYRPDEPIRRTQYGRLLDVYYLEFLEKNGQKETENQPAVSRQIKPYLLARVDECNTDGTDAADPRVDLLTYTHSRRITPDIIPAYAISAVVGRMQLDNNRWAIIDRSSNGASTQFIDDEGNEVHAGL
ncbi:hypothetical protein RSOL_169460 [Rhizoctonia solani AG-3 Rhs1AP]|uniref:Uncharacterized protein n=1 Tax=Rhizoctonia solani AG-3 Rhs1AP TaxID=1086054 RepID=X8J4U3_9AGAM|nr:hypothetical protein RSOL_169460 [Rhizoctonia solani AG-3 Rhs1AP]